MDVAAFQEREKKNREAVGPMSNFKHNDSPVTKRSDAGVY